MEHSMLGDYQLLKELHTTPFGKKYLAEHQFLKRAFIVYVLPEELSSNTHFVERLKNEVAHLATLKHPHIAPIYDVSQDGPYYYFVTEEATSQRTLKEYLQENVLPEGEIAKILWKVALALDYAHTREIGHFNLNLSNILVAETQEEIDVSLTDFGLTQIIGTGTFLSKTHQILTHTLDCSPTPFVALDELDFKSKELNEQFFEQYQFLSPEQKKGVLQNELSFKVDTYAFGVLSYYLLMKTFPVGFFPLPCKTDTSLEFDWDSLIFYCMEADAENRPSSLIKTLEDVLSQKNILSTALSSKLSNWNRAPVSSNTKVKTVNSSAVYIKENVIVEEKEQTGPKPLLKPSEIARPEYDSDPSSVFKIDTTIARYQPKPQEIKDVEPIMTEMVIIPAGTYYRGSNDGGRDEMPCHKVKLSSFAIDIHAVTNEQFVCFLEAMGGEKDVNNLDMIRLRDSRIKRMGGGLHIESGYAKHPVVGVSWYGAVAYAKWIGKRLPTEAEWEVAAAGGLRDSIFPTGKNIERTHANFFSSDTTAVKSYPPNGYGLYDIAGNVYEWCNDWYDYHYYDMSMQEPNSPKGPAQGVYRVLRGGCWKSLKEDLRFAHRHRNNPGTMNRTYGFRCTCDVSE